MEVLDLFAGIGGMKLAFEKSGFTHALSTDFDVKCKETFEYNFKDKLYLKDIAYIPSYLLPDFDVLTAGFPCQSFSVAGKREGFADKGRGDLFFEIVRILRDRQPEVFLLENVRNLKSHDNGNTFRKMYAELGLAGYHVKHKILNTKEYGNLPQNRDRIYIVGFLSKRSFNNFEFPGKTPLIKTINDCLISGKAPDKYYYNGKPLYQKLKDDVIKRDTIYQWRWNHVRENKNNVCPTLTKTNSSRPIIKDDFGIRKLTPRECLNFQGFPATFVLPGIADNHLYKQIGNSVSVPVVAWIAKQIKKAM